MTYLNVRHTVVDYGKWRPFFDADETRRRAAGATGVNQVYRDANNTNIITLVMEWDNEMNAQKFANDPALVEVMQKAGVFGRPEVAAILTRA
jgi:hypothetical protein